ncbi:MAG: hypothetical protein MUP17_05980 [candidate division Zixibacteria bacterium]|nr:hypothetical protein [candidate division Zixibacteria bacterium]
MFNKKSLLWLCLFFFLVQIASAQMPGIPGPGNMPRMFGEFKMPQVGSYAEYKMTYPSEKVETIVRMSIVGKEKTPDGKELYWYEYQTTDPKTGNIDIVKMLISGDPQKEGTINRMIFKHNKDKAMELPEEMMRMINAPMKKEEKIKKEGEVKNLGIEKMQTPAGILECFHMQYVSENKEASDVWQAKEVPFFGLAKSVTQGVSMEIQKFGKDAKSAITEEPEKLVIPGTEKMEQAPAIDTLKKELPKIPK